FKSIGYLFEKGILKENREQKPPVHNFATFLSANLAKNFLIAKSKKMKSLF
ncbi:MAG: hypothetical protein ACI81T_001322, partial [Bacteroidia bacterium]